MESLPDLIDVDEAQLEIITGLASQGFSASEIAAYLKFKKREFMSFWRQEDHPIRVAYERGLLIIKATKAQALENSITRGNITALQIHDKNQKRQAFEAVKQDIFNCG